MSKEECIPRGVKGRDEWMDGDPRMDTWQSTSLRKRSPRMSDKKLTFEGKVAIVTGLFFAIFSA
jgi:hypothetical protein